MLDFISERIDEDEKIVPGTVLDRMGEGYLTEINAIFSVGDEIKDGAAANYYRDCVNFLEKNKTEGEIRDLQEFFTQETDTERRRQIAENIQKKIKVLEKLRTEDK